MKFFSKISPESVLRVSLGAMYLYSGFDLMTHPTAWYWSLPGWTKKIIISVVPLDTFLRIHGSIEILLALTLLAWFLKPRIVKWVALISFLEFAAILALAFMPFSEANFLITFRDIGLLGASLALYIIIANKNKGANTMT